MAEKVYLPNLNGLRAIAAFMVVVHHVEQMKKGVGLPNSFYMGEYNVSLGDFGVTLFFVLSGFLITYLLLLEKQGGKVDIFNFYIRRALRIWPVYYFVVFLSFGLLAHIDFFVWDEAFYFDYWENLCLYIFLLPNVALGNYLPFPFASVAWSIGVEEQFYLLWPWLIKKSKRYLWLFAITAIASIGSLTLAILLYDSGVLPDVYGFVLWKILLHTRIECMAVGAMGAYLVWSRPNSRLLEIVYSKWAQLSILFAAICLVVSNASFKQFSHFVYSIVFVTIVINLACNKNNIFRLEYGWLNYLGKISYGLYMYHGICLFVVVKLYYLYGPEYEFFSYNSIVYLATVVTTVIFASASYVCIERPMLRRKSKFSLYVSGDLARPVMKGENKVPRVPQVGGVDVSGRAG